jgi:uncharacterized protein YciI
MKKLLPFVIIGLFVWSCSSTTKEVDKSKETSKSSYDSLLAQKYNADPYGMKSYVIAFLKRGPNPSKDSSEAVKLQKAHLENINRLAQQGTLVLAGPFFGDGDLRGIYIFDVSSIEEAEKLTASDPLIQSGGLVMELHKWYGSAALMAIPEIHKKLEQVNFAR